MPKPSAHASSGGRERRHDLPWTCDVVLKNLHSLCYVNASILSLFHCLHSLDANFGPLLFLRRILEQSVRKGADVLLVQMQLFRRLVPSWTFDAVQHDSAEYLHMLFEQTNFLSVLWDTRCSTPEGIQLKTQGIMPIGIPVQGCDTLQDSINAWHGHSDITAIVSETDILCFQVGRYTAEGKDTRRLRFSEPVQVPVFTDGLRVQWYRYQVCSVVLHFGRYTTCGHYRALLHHRVGHSWLITDDHKAAAPATLMPGHERNVYILWLTRCS